MSAGELWGNDGGEHVRPAKTPTEMRAEIYRLSHYDSLVRSITTMANMEGLSSEDRYTLLAYQALRQASELRRMTLENAHFSAIPTILKPRG